MCIRTTNITQLPSTEQDGVTLITDKNKIIETRAEYFNGILNCPSSINDEAIQCLPQVEINPDLDIPVSEDEVTKAVKQMLTGKAPGPDDIPAEVFKSGGLYSILHKLTTLFQSFWESETLLQEFKDATIFHIYKR